MGGPKSYVMDMDGVIVRGVQPVPGAEELVARLRGLGLQFLILTNNSIYTPRDVANRLRYLGIDVDVPDDRVYTSGSARRH